MATEFPRLKPGNAAIIELKEWLEGQREMYRGRLESESDHQKILRTQGKVEIIRELLQSIDPNHRRYGERD